MIDNKIKSKMKKTTFKNINVKVGATINKPHNNIGHKPYRI